MSLTVRDIMDPAPETVRPDTPVEEVVRILRDNELSGVPVVNEGGRCVGIITEEDLIMAGDEEDLHLPRFIEMFGGIVFLESMEKFEERLQRATASKASDMMTEDPYTIEPDATVREAGRTIGEVLASAVSLLNPSVIVIGGSLAMAGDPLLAGVREVVYRRSLPLATANLRIVQASGGERSGIIGAACLVLDEVLAPAAVDRTLT